MKVKPFTLGPITGETGTGHARLLVRGDPAAAPGERKPFLGRLQVRPENGDWHVPKTFRFNRNFDFTAVVVLSGLTPDTDYEVRGGWVDDAQAAPESLDWTDACTGFFRTAVLAPAEPVEFYLGSCCYRFFRPDGEPEDDRADKAFRGMLRDQREHGAVDFALLVGDQIYADPLYSLGDATSQEGFYRLYRQAFSAPHISRLLAGTSCYMILDDHEVEDGWPQRATARDYAGKYPAALKAYQVYQASHGPAVPLTGDGRYLAQDPPHLWYRFSRGCADFFVMDVRTERAGSRMISPEQENALIDWLDTDPERVKCIVSPVVVFPDARALFRTGDAWDGFARQRARILEAIRRRELPRVVFLSGDVHASLAARLDCRGPSGRRRHIYSLVSSGLFWPSLLFPFRWWPGMVPTESRLDTPGVRARFRVSRMTDVYSGNGFARIRVTPEGIDFRLRDRKGNPLEQFAKSFTFRGR